MPENPPPLSESDVSREPIAQFARWYDDALASELPLPNAMTLATVSADGKPSARMVLLKGFDARGFVFYTNYESRKAVELAANSHASLVFYWPASERQVRIEGRVEKVTARESDQYFRTRPRDSRISAWASPQSVALHGRRTLEDRFEEFSKRYPGEEIPRPHFWGGYRVIPTAVEFWQGRASRLHDRLLYVHDNNGVWRVDRLAP
ncbi:MAG: pyridoxamine 5'-phosphate oxidase [Rudaea sp.]